MGKAYAVTPVEPFAPAIGAAFNTFTARQFVDALPVPVLLPPQMQASVRIWIDAHGEFSTTVTPTLAIGVALGTVGATGALATPVVLAESGAITTGSGAAAWPWQLRYRGIITAVGTAGSITGQGTLELGTALTTLTPSPIPVTAAARVVAIDTTVSRGVGVVATWGTSSASNSIKVYACDVSVRN